MGIEEPAKKRNPAKGSIKALRLLVVEDHADMRRSLGVLFKMLGCRARFAESLQAAREAIQAERFDVLLSDINLPDGDGWELLRELDQNSQRPATAIAMSGFGAESDIAESKAAGFEYHLIKPFSPEELHKVLEGAAARLGQETRSAVAATVKRKVARGMMARASAAALPTALC